MGPRPRTPRMDELPRPRLNEQLKMSHPLIRLASLMNWQEIERSFGARFASSRGRPALSPRLVAPPCQTSCRSPEIADDPHWSAIHDNKSTFN